MMMMMKVMMKRRVIEQWRFLEAMESGALRQKGGKGVNV